MKKIEDFIEEATEICDIIPHGESHMALITHSLYLTYLQGYNDGTTDSTNAMRELDEKYAVKTATN